MAAHPHPLSIPNFRAYWAARLTATLAQYGMILLIGWQTYNIARETMGPSASAAQLGFIGLLHFLPLFFLPPAVAWVADHMHRRDVPLPTVRRQFFCPPPFSPFPWHAPMPAPGHFLVSAPPCPPPSPTGQA